MNKNTPNTSQGPTTDLTHISCGMQLRLWIFHPLHICQQTTKKKIKKGNKRRPLITLLSRKNLLLHLSQYSKKQFPCNSTSLSNVIPDLRKEVRNVGGRASRKKKKKKNRKKKKEKKRILHVKTINICAYNVLYKPSDH